MLVRFLHPLLFLLSLISFFACSGEEGLGDGKLPCRGACVTGLVCVDERCVLPADQAFIESDIEMDATVLPLDQMLLNQPPLEGAECLPNETRPCDDERACSQAFQRCVNGVWSSCVTPQERCDLLDNDCDGIIDEGYQISTICEVGIGACVSVGEIVCDEEGGVRCDQSPGEPSPELCNEIDDDCDGRTDELFVQLGSFCEVGVGACLRTGSVICGGDLAPTCNAVAAEPSDEVCDGLDNDCDGRLDEADPQLGQICTSDFPGLCSDGKFVCHFSQLSCEPNLAPSQERCDGLDNDCDGLNDEDGPPLGEACSAGLFGECDRGLVVCDIAGEWLCESQQSPEAERCDGLDSDCDGVIDEVVPELGELCDTSLLGECNLGQYACRQGMLSCDELIEPQAESCDNRDEDCDGFIDEDTNVDALNCDTEERGVCGVGLEVCEFGEVHCRRVEPPREERCDGLDNDCDGFVDEDFRDLGRWCEVGEGACRAEGLIGCDEAQLESTCLAQPYLPQEERCDDVDNDCNGLIDDLISPPSEPQHCGACGIVCEIPHAVNRCVSGRCEIERCAADWFDLNGDPSDGCEDACKPTDPADEGCDGLDNDCDGVVDSQDCAGDTFRFCEDRTSLGIQDLICETFPPDRAQWSHWPLALIRPGSDPLNLDRQISAENYPFLGGSVTRRVMYDGPSYQVGFSIDYRGSDIGIGMFKSEMELDEIPDGNEGEFNGGQGYALVIESIGGVLNARIYRSPDQLVLWSASIPTLNDRLRHWIEWRRLHDGAWSLRIDGVKVEPSQAEPADQSTEHFDRLNIWLGAADEESSYIDSYILRYDEDSDDVYRPLDNCRYVYNPAQIDRDEDGRGLACDDQDGDGIENGQDLCNLIPNPAQLDQDQNGVGDACDFSYALAIGASFGGSMSVWTIDLESGTNHPNDIPTQSEQFDVHSSLDGWWTWSSLAIIWMRTPETEEATRIEMGFMPDFIGESLVYLSLDRRSVMTMPRDLSGFAQPLYSAPQGHELAISISPLEDLLVVMERDEDGTMTAFEMSAEGTRLTERVFMPAAEGEVFPKLNRHPQRPLYLVSALDGVAQGISLLDGETGILEPISYRPTGNAVFTPSGDGLISIYTDDNGEGNVIEQRGLSENSPARTIFGPSTFISADGLEPVAIPDEVADTDGDGRPDDQDSCPNLPQIQSVTSHSIEGVPFNTRLAKLYPLADGYALAWREGYNRGLLRLSRLGETLQSLDFDSSRIAYANISARQAYFPLPIWVKDHYEFVFFYSDGAWHREVKRRPMSHDWRLGDSVSLTNTDFDSYNFQPLNLGARLTDQGYRVDAQSYNGGGRMLEFDLEGNLLDSNLATESMGWNCFLSLPKRDDPPSATPSLYQCLIPYARSTKTVKRNIDGVQIDSNIISLEQTYESSWWRHDIDYDAQGEIGMSIYVDKLYQVRARALDNDGRPLSVERVISGDLVGVSYAQVAAGDESFGVLITADAPGGVKGLYFMGLKPNALPSSSPLLLTPPGVGIYAEEMEAQLLWDGEAWIAIWGDDRGGYQFSRGRFDCP